MRFARITAQKALPCVRQGDSFISRLKACEVLSMFVSHMARKINQYCVVVLTVQNG
jgi:hypothetical protein